MADDAPIDLRRRYARPGEFEAKSVLDSNSFKQRLGGQLNPDRESPAPDSRELPIGGEPARRNPSPLSGEARTDVEPNQHSRSIVRLPRQLPPGRESDLRRSPAPVESEARFSVDLNQRSRSAVPLSRQLPPARESNLRRSPAPTGSQGRSSMNLNQYRRSPAPPTSREGISRRRTSARFELLPEPPSRWNRIGV